MTLIELLMALAVTAVIGLAVSMMLVATVRGAASQSQMRRVMVRQKVLTGRLAATIRQAMMVLDADADSLVLWTSDANADGDANLSELRLITHDDEGNLISYAAPDDLSPGSDTAYDTATTDFMSALTGQAGSSDFPGETWCAGVTGWAVSLDGPAVTMARRVTVRFTVTVGDESDSIVMTAAMRSGT